MEHVLAQKRLLIVDIHSSQLPMDRLLVGYALLVNARAPHAERAMIERFFPTVTFLGNQFSRLGSAISDPLNCANLLDADEAIISRLLAQHQVIAADLRRKLDTDTDADADAGIASHRVASFKVEDHEPGFEDIFGAHRIDAVLHLGASSPTNPSAAGATTPMCRLPSRCWNCAS